MKPALWIDDEMTRNRRPKIRNLALSAIVIGSCAFFSVIAFPDGYYDEGITIGHGFDGRPISVDIYLPPRTDLSSVGLTNLPYFSTEPINVHVDYSGGASYAVVDGMRFDNYPLRINGESGDAYISLPSFDTWSAGNNERLMPAASQRNEKKPKVAIMEWMASGKVSYLQPRTYTLEDMRGQNENTK